MTIVRSRSRYALGLLILALVSPLCGYGQPPAVVTPPANISAVSGSNVILSVTASGATPLSYQWVLFDSVLAGRTNSTLTLSNISIDQGGVYTVRITNAFGAITSAPVLVSIDEHRTFRILQLQTNGVQAIECGSVIGDDRGGIVVTPNYVFVTGDNTTARFSPADLTGGASIGRQYDSMCSNLRTEQPYVLGNGTNIVGFGGTVNSLLELDRDTGLLTGNRINLSTNVFVFSGGVFSGYDRIVLMDGSRNIFDIALPSGQVTFRGSVPNLFRTSSESWASWGIAEYFTNTLHLVYVESGPFPYTNIARIAVRPNSFSTPVQGFTSLADLASIAFSTSRSRWYFRYEGSGQFRSGDETLGSAKALFTTNGGVPYILRGPQPQTNYPGDTVTLRVEAVGNGPFDYQWRLNGQPITAPNSPTLVLNNVDLPDSGFYSVDVGNAAGVASSAPVLLFIVTRPQILLQPVTQSAVPGTNVSFQIGFQAAPPYWIQWYHDGTNIPNATNVIYDIPAVTSTSAGSYHAVVTNRYGSATSMVARLSLIAQAAFSFKVLALSNDAVIAEHLAVTGDDRGGLGVSSNRVFVTGDNGSGIFSAADLTGGTLLPVRYDALVTDLRTEKVYSLGAGTNLFLSTTSLVITTLIEINGDTGVRTTNLINLSQPIEIVQESGLFSGYGQIVIHTGTRVFSIALPSGVVADLGTMFHPFHQSSEFWAYWGIAENFGGSVYLVYVQDGTSIVRTRVPDGLTTSVANFIHLADMASIGASVRRGRWYFHHQGPSEFGGTNETVGYCSALFSVVPNPIVDHFTWEPLPGAQFLGVPFPVTITARTIDDTVISTFSGRVNLAGFTSANGLPVNVIPALSGNFTNGVWSGQITVNTPTPGMTLRASDAAGFFGISTPFSVVTTNDLALELTPSTNAATLYKAIAYHLLITNSGPGSSTAVFATNVIPAEVDFVSATSSQGSCTFQDGVVVCDIGTMASAFGVTVEIVVVPQSLSALTNVAAIGRAELEDHLENNAFTNVITVSMPAITFTDASVLEGNTSATRGTNIFLVELNTTSAVPVYVRFTTAPGTAVNTGDYVTRTGLITFAPGVTSTNIRVTIGAESNYELDEYFFLNFFNVTNAMLVRTQAIGTIINDDAAPTLVVSDVTVVEGDGSTALVSIPVRLSAAAGVPISVNYATSNGTAFVVSDFQNAAGVLNFPGGTTNVFLSIRIVGDTLGESNEFFYINFFNGGNITVNTQMLVVILNQDPIGVDHFQFSSIGGTQFLNTPFPVTVTALNLSNDVVSNFSGPVTLSGVGGAGEAVVTIGSGNTTWFEPLFTYWHDSRTQVIYPPDELRSVKRIRSLALNVVTLPGQALNNWTIRMKHTAKNDFGTGGFETTGWTTVLRTNINITTLGWVTFNFSTPFDYNGVQNLMIDFSHNNSSFTTEGYVRATIAPTLRSGYYNCDSCQGDPLLWSSNSPGFNPSTIVPDIRLETAGAALKIAPTNTQNFTNGSWTGNLVVLEPGDGVRLQATDAAQHAGVSGSFDVVLSDDIAVRVTPSADPVPVGETLTFFMTVSNAGPNASTGVRLTNTLPANAAHVGSTTDRGTVSTNLGAVVADIGTLGNGEVATVSVSVLPDGLGIVTNTVVIRRDQAEPYLGNNAQTNRVQVVNLFVDIPDVSLTEGHAGTTNAVFLLTLSGMSTQTVSVAYETADLFANAGLDYGAVRGVVTFPPGVTNTTVAVPVYGDRLNEEVEDFLLSLTAVTNAVLVRDSAVGVIFNDDPLPMVFASATNILEGRNGFAAATITFALSGPSGKEVSFSLFTVDDTASDTDYVPTNLFVTLPPGQTVTQATVLVRGDGLVELDEQFFVLLYSPNQATFADAELRITIVNDDTGSPGVFDYFEWNSIPSPQTIGRAINVTVTARDGVGALYPFNGVATLLALSGTNILALSPTNSGLFVDGVWSGSVALSNPAANVVLVADDGAGHNGFSDPFDVNVTDVTLEVSAPPQVLIASPFTYTLTVSNAGVAAATVVTVTNVIPADAELVGAFSSIGGCAVIGGVVACELGTLLEGGTAEISVVVNPLRGGPLTNRFRASAFEFDTTSSNNAVAYVVEITGDNDFDALPDTWEEQNGLSSSNPFDANQDPDQDGHTSLQEYVAGTSPTNPQSVLRATALFDGGSPQIRFRTAVDRRYIVQRAPSANGPWVDITGELFGDGDVAVIVDFEPWTEGPRFYRIQVIR